MSTTHNPFRASSENRTTWDEVATVLGFAWLQAAQNAAGNTVGLAKPSMAIGTPRGSTRHLAASTLERRG